MPRIWRVRARPSARAAARRASNVFTRLMLALFGFIPWRAVPVMPVEIMLLPKWFPFHLDKISYWSRTVIVPLLVLQALKPKARNPKGVAIDELFLEPPQTIGAAPKAPQQKASWFWFFRARRCRAARRRAVVSQAARGSAPSTARWHGSTERLNGEDGLGAIFPAMANSVMMFDVLGYPEDHPRRAIARKSVEKLLVVHEHEAYCQPCVSPIWDTGLACHALLEVGGDRARGAGPQRAGLAGAASRSSTSKAIGSRGDPTCVPAAGRSNMPIRTIPMSTTPRWWSMAMDRAQGVSAQSNFRASIAPRAGMDLGDAKRQRRLGRVRCRQRILLSQQHSVRRPRRLARSSDRGRDRALRLHAGADRRDAENSAPVKRAVDYLRRTQLEEGSWYGRWGMNYIYGTWSVLCALNAAGVDHASPEFRKAVAWLREDSEFRRRLGRGRRELQARLPRLRARRRARRSQTAWALLGLMAAGEVDHPAVSARHRLSLTQPGQ